MPERSLDQYLRDADMDWILTVRKFLRKLDWQPFVARYDTHGRAAYAPWSMMGIVMYGVLKGIDSLRDLEKLARLDLGCMWLSGAIARRMMP